MRRLSAQISRQVAGCEDGPCPNWYELVNGDFLLQGESIVNAAGLAPTSKQAMVRVPRTLIREGLAEVQVATGCNSAWMEFDADHLVFVGEHVTDPEVLAGIEASPGEIFIRLNRADITVALAEAA